MESGTDIYANLKIEIAMILEAFPLTQNFLFQILFSLFKCESSNKHT